MFYKTVSLIFYVFFSLYSLLLYSNFYDPVKEHLYCKMSFTAIFW